MENSSGVFIARVIKNALTSCLPRKEKKAALSLFASTKTTYSGVIGSTFSETDSGPPLKIKKTKTRLLTRMKSPHLLNTCLMALTMSSRNSLRSFSLQLESKTLTMMARLLSKSLHALSSGQLTHGHPSTRSSPLGSQMSGLARDLRPMLLPTDQRYLMIMKRKTEKKV